MIRHAPASFACAGRWDPSSWPTLIVHPTPKPYPRKVKRISLTANMVVCASIWMVPVHKASGSVTWQPQLNRTKVKLSAPSGRLLKASLVD